jgi:hypothetical protein
MKLSEKFEEALIYATRAHGNQTRKKTGIPFIAHILGVTAIALEYGANETEAIAALLHDTVEDCGGAKRLCNIREKFGDDVARIVDGCTDTYETPKPRGWNENKGTSAISRIPILLRGWCQPLTSCTTRARSWRNSEDMAWKCSIGLRGKRMEPFGITGRLSPRFGSMAITPISSTS